MDREKVIKGLEHCRLVCEGVSHNPCNGCPYQGNIDCADRLKTDTLELLKEDCHNCKLECLLQKYDELKEKYDALLKEQDDMGKELTDAMELIHKKNERIKKLEEQIETLTKWRANAGAFD